VPGLYVICKAISARIARTKPKQAPTLQGPPSSPGPDRDTADLSEMIG